MFSHLSIFNILYRVHIPIYCIEGILRAWLVSIATDIKLMAIPCLSLPDAGIEGMCQG